MTLLIGVLCQDGVVIGADSAGTMTAGTSGICTVQVPCEKVVVLDDVLIAGAGDGGMHQRFVHIAKDHPPGERASSIDYAVWLSKLTRSHFESSGACTDNYCALMAFAREGQPRLVEFDNGFQPEFRNKLVWWVCKGTGQLIADPVMSLLRSIFWTDQQPTIADAKLVIAWAINHVISVTASGGVAGPVQLTVLRCTEKVTTDRLSDYQVLEHLEAVRDAMLYFRQWPKRFTSSVAPGQAI